MLAVQLFLSIIILHLPPRKCIPPPKCTINYIETVLKLPDNDTSSTIKSVKNVKNTKINVILSPSVEDCVNRCGNYSECGSFTYEENSTRCSLYGIGRGIRTEKFVTLEDITIATAARYENQTMLYAERECIIISKCRYEHRLLMNGMDFIIQWKGKYLHVDLGMNNTLFLADWSKSSYTWFTYDNDMHAGPLNAGAYRLSNYSDLCLDWSKENRMIGVTSCQSQPTLILENKCFSTMDMKESKSDNWQELKGFGKLYINFNPPSKGQQMTCERSNMSNGHLLPEQYHAPIFLIGDVIKVVCDDGFQINKRDQSKNVTIICGHQTQLPRKCVRKVNKPDVRSGGVNYFDNWWTRAFMGAICSLVILMIVYQLCVCYKRRSKKKKRSSSIIVVENIVMENACTMTIQDCETASSENRYENIEIAAAN